MKITEPKIHPIYEPTTGTWQYLIADPTSLSAIVIDPVLDYNPSTQTINTSTADTLLSLISSHDYTISKILETHAHADHLTAAVIKPRTTRHLLSIEHLNVTTWLTFHICILLAALRHSLSGLRSVLTSYPNLRAYMQYRLEKIRGFRPPIGIGKRIVKVQEMFGARYGVPEVEWQGAFDELFEDGEVFSVGDLAVQVMHLPGHTPDHVGYVVGDNVFCGDSLFHADIGTARCDFPGGSASDMYYTAQKLMQLPNHFKIWTGHDYVSKEREEPAAWMTVEDHKERNKWLAQDLTSEQFVERRMKKDEGLSAPKLLHPSLQVNIRAGRVPNLSDLGLRLLHLPLKIEGEVWPGA